MITTLWARSATLLTLTATISAMLTACTTTPAHPADRSFSDDVAFLRKHRDTIVLSAPAGSGKVAVVPAFQARVMTSSARGDNGQAFGFLKDVEALRGQRQRKALGAGVELEIVDTHHQCQRLHAAASAPFLSTAATRSAAWPSP